MKKIKLVAMLTILILASTGTAFGYGYEGESESGRTNGRETDSWYIGFGIGGGTGEVKIDNGPEASEGGGCAMFKVGGIINKYLLIGADISVWVYAAENNATLSFNHVDAVATLFPLGDLGLFVKGGVGLGYIRVEDSAGNASESEEGVDVKLGAGWEFQLGDDFWLGAEFLFATTVFDDFRVMDGSGLVTFSWY